MNNHKNVPVAKMDGLLTLGNVSNAVQTAQLQMSVTQLPEYVQVDARTVGMV